MPRKISHGSGFLNNMLKKKKVAQNFGKTEQVNIIGIINLYQGNIFKRGHGHYCAGMGNMVKCKRAARLHVRRLGSCPGSIIY